MPSIVVLKNLDEIAREAARRVVSIARDAIVNRGRFDIALSGGTTPRSLYQLLASDEYRSQIDWTKACVFWGDERRVPPGDPESDYRMAHELLLAHVAVPEENIFRMQGEGLLNSAKVDYENKLTKHFNLARREFPRFDLILLGLGADGHTASIFPGTRAVSDLTNLVIIYEVPQLGAERMTISRSVINNARNILFLVSGEDKAAALEATLEGAKQPSRYPAQGITPVDGELTWLVDKAAASKLKVKPSGNPDA